jgi:NAD(P)-dependent dehydrogenase (short-subunit alcohol dehydrogenase family)
MSDTAAAPLEGRVAVVTGGSRGIGCAAAGQLARLGATVVVVGRTEAAGGAAADRLVDAGLDAVGVGCDVSDLAAVAALPQRLGPLGAADILVCAAGVMSAATAKTLRGPDDEWRRVLGVNLDGTYAAIRAFTPGMVERRWGRVIAVSACLGRFTGPGTAGGLAPYRVSKTAVNALIKNLAAELGQGARGVYADAVCPGHCRTDMGGPNAPRSAEEGADTIAWLAAGGAGDRTGLLWEDRTVVPW